MIEIKITADDAFEAHEQLRRLCGATGALPNVAVGALSIGAAIGELPAALRGSAPAEEPAVEPEVVEEAPKRRGRPKKEAAPAPAPEPEPVLAIQQGDDEPEEEEAEEEEAATATRDEVRAAMKGYLQKFGEEPIMQHGPALLGGFPTVSAMPDDAALFGAAVARFGAAVEAGKADHGL